MSIEISPNEHFELDPTYFQPDEAATELTISPEKVARGRRIVRHLAELSHGLTSTIEQAGSWRHTKMALHVSIVLVRQTVHHPESNAVVAVRMRAYEVVPKVVQQARRIGYAIRELNIDPINRRLHPKDDEDPVVVSLPSRLGEGTSSRDLRFSIGEEPEGAVQIEGQVAQLLGLYHIGDGQPHELHAIIDAHHDEAQSA